LKVETQYLWWAPAHETTRESGDRSNRAGGSCLLREVNMY